MNLNETICKSSDIRLHDGVSVMVCLSGTISGQITINFSEELVKFIYQRYTKGIPVVEIDNEVKETIFTLSKLIIGNSCASLYGNGISMEVSSCCIVDGYNVNYISVNRNVSVIYYETSLEEMNIMLILDIDEESRRI